MMTKQGKTWLPGPIRPAPFPHSGHPEVLAAREGPVLHIAQTGIHGTADAGVTWRELSKEGSGYYPRAVQVPDGRILCVYHHGGDNGYGDYDQSIGLCIFRLLAE